MREPSFWWRERGITAALLSPLAPAYGAIAIRRLRQSGARAAVPVVCIGNPTIGGAGKTPAALAVARMLQAEGATPVFLSRGYGGSLAGPVRVDPVAHRASEVGDEPLLLARAATTIIARDRVAGAQAAVEAGAGIIVMDDGFQNPSLIKDVSVLVVDARRGVGNGCVLPAGPLRAPLDAQLDRADALIVVGGAGADDIRAAARTRGLPVFDARLEPDARFLALLGDRHVLAFAGIGDPDKFFATLRSAGVAVDATSRFGDHHRFTRPEAQALCEEADREGLVLVTTEKDAARMQGDAELAELAARARVLPVTMVFDDEAALCDLLRARLARARESSPHEP